MGLPRFPSAKQNVMFLVKLTTHFDWILKYVVNYVNILKKCIITLVKNSVKLTKCHYVS